MLRLIHFIHALSVLICLFVAPEAMALPGEVLEVQKISSTLGGLVGPLADSDNFGSTVAALGDLDGDGIGDMAVGVERDDDGGGNAGAVYILFLNSNGSVKAEQKISPMEGGFFGALDADDRFGGVVNAIGDLDGDGLPEIAVGARRDDDGGFRRGAVWILFLNANGTVKAHQKISDTSGGVSPVLADLDNFSTATAIGDLDLDGTTEIAVGAWGDATGGTSAGALWILFLRPDGTVHHRQKIAPGVGGFTGSLLAGDRFGSDTTGLGDLNGDGIPDVAVSADSTDDGGVDRGAVWILFLNRDGTVQSQRKISDTQGGFTGELNDTDVIGLEIERVGDLNGDGVVDLAVGASGDDDGGDFRGAVWIWFLNTDGTVAGHQKISDSAGGFSGFLDNEDAWGAGIAALGDLDGDGVTELAVSTPADDDGGPNRGAAYVLSLDGSVLTCGNGVLDPIEECDDGGTEDFDGCSATCAAEDALAFFGIASSTGLLTVGVDEIDVNLSVVSGDAPATLATLLATLINGTPALSARGTTAQAVQNTVYTHGRFGTAQVTADDVRLRIDPGSVIDEEVIGIGEGGFSGLLGQDRFGSAIALMGDLDNDGVDDVAVGAQNESDTSTAQGAVWILFLNPDGTVKAHQKINAAEGGFTGTLSQFDAFGSSLAALGDLDGDGIEDLAVGARGDNSGQGAVWILFLNADGTVKSHQKINDALGGFSGVLDFADGFGVSLSNIGDFNGDGIADLAVGAFRDGDGGNGHGAVWILGLDTNGTVQSTQKISDTQGGFTGILSNFDQFGRSIAAIGDLDGDGIGDLAVGADFDSDGGSDHGAVWILFMAANGTVKTQQKISDTAGNFFGILSTEDRFGTSTTRLGDIDGDGIGDLAVGAIGDNDGGGEAGAVWVLFMNSDGTVKNYRKVSRTQGGLVGPLDESGEFGSAVAALGDLNDDGRRELGVGASRADGAGFSHGEIWVLSLDDTPPAICSDGEVQLPETCDDGNLLAGDGCYVTCEEEDELELSGTAQGGTLLAVLSGVPVLISTSPGQAADTVLENLVGTIDITPAFSTLGIEAVALPGRAVTNGTFDSVTVNDPGLVVPEPGYGLALMSGGLLLAALARRKKIQPQCVFGHSC